MRVLVIEIPELAYGRLPAVKDITDIELSVFEMDANEGGRAQRRTVRFSREMGFHVTEYSTFMEAVTSMNIYVAASWRTPQQ